VAARLGAGACVHVPDDFWGPAVTAIEPPAATADGADSVAPPLPCGRWNVPGAWPPASLAPAAEQLAAVADIEEAMLPFAAAGGADEPDPPPPLVPAAAVAYVGLLRLRSGAAGASAARRRLLRDAAAARASVAVRPLLAALLKEEARAAARSAERVPPPPDAEALVSVCGRALQSGRSPEAPIHGPGAAGPASRDDSDHGEAAAAADVAYYGCLLCLRTARPVPIEGVSAMGRPVGTDHGGQGETPEQNALAGTQASSTAAEDEKAQEAVEEKLGVEEERDAEAAATAAWILVSGLSASGLCPSAAGEGEAALSLQLSPQAACEAAHRRALEGAAAGAGAGGLLAGGRWWRNYVLAAALAAEARRRRAAQTNPSRSGPGPIGTYAVGAADGVGSADLAIANEWEAVAAAAERGLDALAGRFADRLLVWTEYLRLAQARFAAGFAGAATLASLVRRFADDLPPPPRLVPLDAALPDPQRGSGAVDGESAEPGAPGPPAPAAGHRSCLPDYDGVNEALALALPTSTRPSRVAARAAAEARMLADAAARQPENAHLALWAAVAAVGRGGALLTAHSVGF
jgi:hypothetical protein